MLSSSLTAQTLKSYAGRLSQFAEFCHDSENISPLEATTATVVRYVAWIGCTAPKRHRNLHRRRNAHAAMKLSEQQILQKTRLDNLADVRNLNLWGQDIDNVSVLKNMPSVEVLSLSVNKITTLRDFMHCRKLQELYLRKNEVQSLADVQYLVSLPELSVLWLSDNPCAETPDYRAQVIRALPALTKLDNEEIKPEERAAAEAAELPPLPRPATPPLGVEDELPAPTRREMGRAGSAPEAVPRHTSPSERPRSASRQGSPSPPSNGLDKGARGASGPVPPSARARSGSPPVAPAGRPPTAAPSTADAVLHAVLKLLEVLDDADLTLVRRKIDARFGLI
eukprot:jgi/Tetstr1/430825/TSEL_020608.t1